MDYVDKEAAAMDARVARCGVGNPRRIGASSPGDVRFTPESGHPNRDFLLFRGQPGRETDGGFASLSFGLVGYMGEIADREPAGQVFRVPAVDLEAKGAAATPEDFNVAVPIGRFHGIEHQSVH